MEPLEPRLALSGADTVEIEALPAAEWGIAPYALSPTAVSMRCVMPTVESTQYSYYFQCTTDDSYSSSWQTMCTYVVCNLPSETTLGFQVKMKKGTEESDFSSEASATTQALPADAIAEMTTAVTNLVNQIRAVETFSNPDNLGRITAQLRANDYPDPTAPNTPMDNPPPTEGLAAYPGDGRNTPGAFQVDLANMSVNPDVAPPNPDYYERFGEWKGYAEKKKGYTVYDTEIAFSAQTLADYFNVIVNESGLITSIGAPAASVFLHDDAIAEMTGWSATSNPLIGLHIDCFQPEQLGLYLAGRVAGDSSIGLPDPRVSPQSVMDMSSALQYQVSKDYCWGTYRNSLINWLYADSYRNSMSLIGATLQIKSTVKANIFGVNENDVFYSKFTPAFVMGGMYVSGAGAMYGFLKALMDADQFGSGTWKVVENDPTFDVHITRTQTGPTAADKIFTVDKTPLNLGDEYPTILHYAAVLSPFAVVDQATSYMIDIADIYADAWGYEGRNIKDGLGYERLTTVTNVSGTKNLDTGGRYNYTEMQDGKILTLIGAETFVVSGQSASAAGPKIDTSGYKYNSSGTVAAGQTIDISDFVNEGIIENNTQIYNSSFYVWWIGSEVNAVRVKDVDFSQIGVNAYLYFAPDAQTEAGFAKMIQALKDETFGYEGSGFVQSARLLLSPKDVLGKPTSADQWATHFTTSSAAGGTGVIDASATTGNVLIILDDTIGTVKLGSGTTTIVALIGNAGKKTYVLNPSATASQTIDIRSGDIIDSSLLPSQMTWAAGTASTFDNNVTSPTAPYLRYSYYADWTGTQGSETVTFQAIVRADGNTGTDDPEKIVQNALDPLKVTVNRATAQPDQTSASQLYYTVVFSEEVVDFDESEITLGGNAATIDDAEIVVTNPSGDQMTFSVAITLKDTASIGDVTSSISSGEVHNEDGFTNLVSTSTYNKVYYKPNTITGREMSNTSQTLVLSTQGGEPLPGILVTLSKSASGFTTRTTTTDSNGYYTFNNVPNGTYQVTVTPPSACLTSGANTTTVTAEDSLTYEADFTVGALKPGYIPNRMMVTSSLPVGSIQWQQVVREALNIGSQTASQSVQTNVAAVASQPVAAQYLTLASLSERLATSTTAAVAQSQAVANTATVQVAANVAQTVQTAAVASMASVPSATEANVSGDVQIQTDGSLGGIAHTAVVPSLASDAASVGTAPAWIAQTDLAPIVEEAIERWESAGLEQDALEEMRNTTFVVSDLPGLYLGMAQGGTVWIDWDAAGQGWFADSTPDDDDEFDLLAQGNALQAIDPQAVDRIDLLTVVAHELGHVAGLEDSDIGGLMGASLGSGLRLLPSAHDAALASV